MAIESRVAELTVSCVEPLVPLRVAPTVDWPGATLAPSPGEPRALLTVAMSGFDEDHVTASVRFCVVASEYVPVAVNVSLVPSAMDGFVGVMAIEINVAALTVSSVEPLIAPKEAPIAACPGATLVLRPSEPTALLTIAMRWFDEDQVTVS